MLDAVQRALDTTGDTDDAPRPVPNRADRRRVRAPRSLTRHRAVPHSLGGDGRTRAEHLDDAATAARLDAARARNDADDDPAPWISPDIEQGYRDRRRDRRARKAARRTTRRAAR